ncbi:Hypothetical protein I595_201 [Croceitalea dokdonensis DOKDO 023]|uniref:Uncharacterized protein n=2 Tax=Croceitalea TaxID=574891 RepID=A0A0P7A901_9FLAO|nr:Hypothetical protein I595_201 [Croceitalea dokdonensis DOKDO 023]
MYLSGFLFIFLLMDYSRLKSLTPIACFLLFVLSCTTKQNLTKATQGNLPVVLSEEETQLFEQLDDPNKANIEMEADSTEYDIIIIDIGFNAWLQGIARPKGYYSQSFMESRNYIYVLEWNRRVLQPDQFPPLLYELQIDYDPTIDYGYDVNYQLYNYFIYFQRRYNQRLGPFLPRI